MPEAQMGEAEMAGASHNDRTGKGKRECRGNKLDGFVSLDSTRENRRQEEFNNRVAQVKRPGGRRSVEWLCRRGGRRLRVCWPAGAGGWGGGGSGYWRAGRTAVCGRRERAAQPEPLWG